MYLYTCTSTGQGPDQQELSPVIQCFKVLVTQQISNHCSELSQPESRSRTYELRMALYSRSLRSIISSQPYSQPNMNKQLSSQEHWNWLSNISSQPYSQSNRTNKSVPPKTGTGLGTGVGEGSCDHKRWANPRGFSGLSIVFRSRGPQHRTPRVENTIRWGLPGAYDHNILRRHQDLNTVRRDACVAAWKCSWRCARRK